MRRVAIISGIVVCVLFVVFGFLAVIGGDGSEGRHWLRRQRAQLELKRIRSALETFRREIRPMSWPIEFHALFEPRPGGEEPLLDPDTLEDGKLLDPWGSEYQCLRHSDSTIEVISYGADGAPGGEGAAEDLYSGRIR